MNSIQPPSKSTCFSFALLPLIAIFAMLFAHDANASHYRGAAASYTIDASGVVTVTIYSAWRSDFVGGPAFSIYTGSGSTGTNLGAMTQTSSVNPFSLGTEFGGALYVVRKDTFTRSLSGQAPGFYYARWTGCCWVAGINNVPESSWAIELKIAYTPGVASAGPTMIPATIDIIGRGFPYTQNLNSTDPDGTPVTYQNLVGNAAPEYAPTSLIPGISVSGTGAISVPPASTATMALGRWGYKVRVTDGSGGTAIRDVLVVAADPIGGNANQPPVLAPIGAKAVNVNNLLSFNVSGTDPDSGQTLTVRAQGLPAGATFPQVTGPASGTSSTFTWTPSPGQDGTYVVNFEVYDSAAVTLIDSEEVTIEVTGGNNPPVLSMVGNQVVANGATLSFNLSANDVDGNSITYQMFGGPAGATLTPAGAFSWTPTLAQYDSVFTGVTFRATDNGVPNRFDEETVAITVGAGNRPPVTSAPSLVYTVSVGQNLSFLVSGADLDTTQTITLSANAGLPGTATFPTVSGSASAGVSSTFSWTPTLASVGSNTVSFLTQDNGTPVLNHQISVTITVTNKAPVNGALGDVVTGNDAPDSNGNSDGTQFDMLTRGGYIAETGAVVFPGELKGTNVNGTNFKAYWKHNGVTLTRLTRTSQAAPETGSPAAAFSDLSATPGINDDGQVTLLAALSPNPLSNPPTTTDNDTGLWSELGGTGFQILMREDDQIPGLPVGTKIGKFENGCYATARISATEGEAAFTITMKGTSTDSALLRTSVVNSDTTGVTVVAREGQAAPGVAGQTFGFLNSDYTDAARMDAQGNIVFGAYLKPSISTSLWYQPRGGALVKAVVAGDAAPNAAGATPIGSATFAALDVPSMAANGTFAFRAVLNRDGDNADNSKNDGIWRVTAAGGFSNILRRGDSNANRPGLFANATIKAGNIYSGWLTNGVQGHGAWLGWVDTAGDGISAYPADTFGIYTDMSGTMDLLISSGDAAPGIVGATMYFIDHPVVSGSGANEYLAFIATVTGGGTNDKGIWRSLNGAAPTLVLRIGDSITTTQGSKIIADMDIPGSNLADHQWEQRVMDATGKLVLFVTFIDGSTSQILVP